MRLAVRPSGIMLTWLSLGSFVGAAAVVLYLVAGSEWLFPTDAPIVGYLTLTAVLGVMAIVCVRWLSVSGGARSLDILELPVWYTLWTVGSIVLFGVLPFTDQTKYQLDVPVSGEAVVMGLWLPLLGLAGLWLGYSLSRLLLRGGKVAVGVRIPRRPLRARTLAFYGLIMLERLWRIRTVGTAYGSVSVLDELSGLNQWSIYLEESVYLIVAVTALQVFLRQWPASYLVCMVGVELLFDMVSGSTKPLLWLGVALFGASQYSGRTIQLRFVWRWLIVALVALVMVPIVEQYRSFITESTFDTHSPSDAIQGVLQATRESWGTDPGATTQVLIGKLTVRQALVAQTLGLVVQETPSAIPFWGAERLLAIPSYLVPRILWPDKPNLSTGIYFAVNYLRAPEDTASSAAFTIFGDLYVSAGWMATIVGMIVLGSISAVLYHTLKVRPQRQSAYNVLALYVAIAVGMLDVEGSYIGIMVGLVQRGLLYAVIFWLLHAPGHSRSPLHLAVRAV